MKVALLALFLLTGKMLFAEGTKQLKPTATDNGAIQIYDFNSSTRNFATYTAPAEKRLYIHISNPTNEKIYMGFNQPEKDVYFRLKDPSGTMVMGPSLVPASGNGFISTYAQAVAGPSALNASGYAALSYQPLAAGDYYIEFSPQSATTPVYVKRVLVVLFATVISNRSEEHTSELQSL